MPKDREITSGDALDITKQSIRLTVNFQGPVGVGDTLGFFQIDSDNEIESLKDWLTGKNDIEVGVTNFFYRLDRQYLNDMTGDWTVTDVSARILGRSIPDMNFRRGMIVVVGCASKVIGHTIPQPDPGFTLEQIGITGHNIGEFKQRILQDSFFGVRRFRRVLEPSVLEAVDTETFVGDLIDILKTSSQPMF